MFYYLPELNSWWACVSLVPSLAERLGTRLHTYLAQLNVGRILITRPSWSWLAVVIVNQHSQAPDLEVLEERGGTCSIPILAVVRRSVPRL